MYERNSEIIKSAQKWLDLALAYQTKAIKLTRKYSSPHEYPDEVFYCYRGYSRCMEMHDACFARIGRIKLIYSANVTNDDSRSIMTTSVEQDEHFITIIAYIVAAIIGVLYADIWVSVIEWLAHYLV